MATQFKKGQIITIAQTRLTATRTISTEARKLFFSPNWKYVKEKLKTKFKMNGRVTKKGSKPATAW